jgi:hypothetical protein
MIILNYIDKKRIKKQILEIFFSDYFETIKGIKSCPKDVLHYNKMYLLIHFIYIYIYLNLIT